MRVKVAVVTVQGKAYFHIVNLLKEHNLPFFSLIPGYDVIPVDVDVVITTLEEKDKIDYSKVLTFTTEYELDRLISQVIVSLQGKDHYEKIVIGIDPGEVIGLVMIADGKIVDKVNCLNSLEMVNKIKSILKNVNLSTTSVRIKVGNGVPVYRGIVEELDNALPSKIVLEVVSERGTNLPLSKRSRCLRHITSATIISARKGCIYQRRELEKK